MAGPRAPFLVVTHTHKDTAMEPSFLGLTETAWFAVGSGLLYTFAGLVYASGGRSTEAQENSTLVHALVCFIAGTMYAMMATNLGTVTVADGRSFDFARYVDWSFTTPLLLFGLALTAMHERLSHAGLIITLLGFDVLMIVTAMFYGLDPVFEVGHKVMWFGLSCIFFLGVIGILWGPLRRHARARGPVIGRVYTRHAAILSVLWLVYPVVLAIGPAGFGTIDAVPLIAAILVLDVTAKGIYGVVSVQGTKEILRERGDEAGRRHAEARGGVAHA